MLIQSWSNVVRHWFSQVSPRKQSSRSVNRRRQHDLSRQVSLEQLEERIVLSAIVVTGTGDAIAVDGFVTLREAITSINGGVNINADVTGVGAYGIGDAINFNMPGAGVQTISPASALPAIVKPVAINGYSQTGASTNTLAASDNAVLLVELSGANAGLGVNGLVLGAGSGGSTVRGLVINAFSGAGILVQSSGNTVSGNFIGTNATGSAGVSLLGGFGIGIDGSSSNTIGGTTPAARNVIGGNTDGINLNTSSQNNVIQGNFIGVAADGTTALGNRLHGVALQGNGGLGIQGNQIGGIVAGAGNTIANNGSPGVAVYGSAASLRQNNGNTILGNSIYSNGLTSPATLPGIDLVGTTNYPTADGVTPNDLGDADSGPNLLTNFPVLTSASSDAVSTTIAGTLNGASNTTFRVEFFSNPTASATGFGEGRSFLGSTNVTTNGTGNATFNTILGVAVPAGQFVTATATGGGSDAGTPVIGPAAVLGSAAEFAALAGSGMLTFSNPSVLIGNVGVSPGTAINGPFTTTGTIHSADAVAAQAQSDLTTAINNLKALAPATTLGVELGGLTLTPGIYKFDTEAGLTGTLNLDTQGDPHALFVFQVGSTLITAVGSNVNFINGPSDNVYWQVGTSATFGATSNFVGNILADASITFNPGANLSNGRALAKVSVTLDGSTADSTTPTQNNTSEFSAPAQIPNLAIPSVTLTVVPATMLEAAGTSTVTATLSAVSALPVTVDLTFAGTGTNLTDYTRSATQIVIAAGSLSGTVTLTAVQDSLDETDETIIVDITGVTNGTELLVQQGTATITDDDAAPGVTLTAAPAAMLEAAGTSTVTATLSALSALPVTVDLTFAGTAANVTDYTRSAAQIVIPAGSLSGTVTLTAVPDLLDEADETVIVDVSAVTNGTETGTQQATASITDDDAGPSVTLGIVPLNVLESGGTATVTATLSAVSGQAVTVDLAFTGTATNLTDYTRSASQIVIPAGSLTGTVTLTGVADALNETNETIVVDINGVTNGTETGTQQVTATITDDGATPSVTLTVLPANMSEAAGVSTVTATLSATSGQTVTIDLAYSGTATNLTDYTRSGAQIVIPAGSLIGTVVLTAVQDTLSEINETIVVDVVSVVNGNEAGVQQVTSTITDDEATPSVTLAVVPLTMVEAAGTSLVTATLSAVSGRVVTVDLLFTGTAVNVTDYTRTAAQIVIPAGSLTGTVTLTAVQDILVETNETIVVDIGSVTNGTESGIQQVTATITDDDVDPPVVVPPTLSISDISVVEGNTGSINNVFVVSLSAPSLLTVTVVATTADGTAVSPSDYTALPATTLTFAPGETTKTVTVASRGDLLDEPDETFFVNLTGAVNANVADSQGRVTILDDDVTPPNPVLPALSINDVSLLEGNAGSVTAVFTVTLSAASTQIVTVVADTANGLGTTPTDYLALSPMTLTFAPGETTKTVAVAVNGDTLNEVNENFAVNLSAPVNATIADNQGMGTIINDDLDPPVVIPPSMSINDLSVVEGDFGTSNTVFTVTLSAPSLLTVTVVATTADGTAVSPVDYTPLLATTITFAPGETSKTVSISSNGDLDDETDEVFFVNLTGAVNANVADGQGTVTILDDDGAPPNPVTPALSINDVALLEGNAGTVNAVFTLTLSAASTQTVTVVASSANGVGTTPSDYIALTQTLTFAPGETSKTVTVVVNGDTLAEVSESFAVNLGTPVNATIADGQGLGTIINDDTATIPTLTIDNATVVEGDTGTTNAVFTVTLSAASAQSVTVVVASANGTATTPSDYLAFGPSTLTFAPGETSKTVSVAVTGDRSEESNETFVVNLSAAVNATLADNQGLGTITNDDVATVAGDPTITIDNPEAHYEIGQKPIFVAPGSSFTYDDVGQPNFANAMLTVSISTGRSHGDKLNIFKKGPGQNQIDTKGKKVFFQGVQIGTLTRGGRDRRPDLVITFNSSATIEAVNNLLQSITFRAHKTPGTNRTIDFLVTNIEGVDSNVGTVEMLVTKRGSMKAKSAMALQEAALPVIV